MCVNELFCFQLGFLLFLYLASVGYQLSNSVASRHSAQPTYFGNFIFTIPSCIAPTMSVIVIISMLSWYYIQNKVIHLIYFCNCTLVSPAVDGDPHFIIELPDKNDSLCFNINNRPGTIFNLVRDPRSGQPGIMVIATFLTLDKMQSLMSFWLVNIYFFRYDLYNPTFFLRYFGQWPGNWRQETSAQWKNLHLLLATWYCAPNPGGEAGGEHSGYFSVPGQQMGQTTVVWYSFNQRPRVSGCTITSGSPLVKEK